ncbi:MAG: DEAD/DEAH box helicase, partial [Cyanobacteriota bacterium]
MAAPWLEIWLEAGREGRVFTYANPDGMAVGLGDLVQVRLQGRRQSGLVVGLPATLPAELAPERVLPIERVIQAAAVDPQWRALIDAVARLCHTSAFKTLRSALPPGWLGAAGGGQRGRARQPWQLVLSSGAQVASAGLGERQQTVLTLLQQRSGPVQQAELARLGIAAAVVRSLESRGLVVRQPLATAMPAPSDTNRAARPLTAAQQQAVEAIQRAAPGSSLLLWGVTGAGKTEVYLQAAANALAEGRGALLLTPEIGLVPQLLDRCRERFGPAVLEWHSGVGEAERIRCWRRCLAAGALGIPQLVVGTRSAVFLPLSPLGLIVLDEEHDGSYKQDSPMPCYHAREVARLRAG